MATVLDLLKADGAEATHIGGRHRCPNCGVRTGLSVRNDTYARCFACSKVWNSNSADVNKFWLSAALNRLASDCISAAYANDDLAKNTLNTC